MRAATLLTTLCAITNLCATSAVADNLWAIKTEGSKVVLEKSISLPKSATYPDGAILPVGTRMLVRRVETLEIPSTSRFASEYAIDLVLQSQADKPDALTISFECVVPKMRNELHCNARFPFSVFDGAYVFVE